MLFRRHHDVAANLLKGTLRVRRFQKSCGPGIVECTVRRVSTRILVDVDEHLLLQRQHSQDSDLRTLRTFVRAVANNIMRAARKPRHNLGILLAADDTIRELNKAYRGCDRPTDVLSFSTGASPSRNSSDCAPRLMAATLHNDLGDLVLGIPYITRQAENGNMRGRLPVLICHGIAHLLGYTHCEEQLAALRSATVEEDQSMLAAEQYLIQEAFHNVGRPFQWHCCGPNVVGVVGPGFCSTCSKFLAHPALGE
eukprot:SAG31_NODE_399_length_16247_cov_19.137540_4_plen_253_part_00